MRLDRCTSCPAFRKASSLLVLLGFLIVSGGCRNCEEKFCNGIRFVRDAGVSLANTCCRNPEAPGCTDLADRLVAMRALVLAADDACHDGNLELLENIWEDFKELVPAGLMLLLCDGHHDLERWMEDGCHPRVNTVVPVLVQDTIDLDIDLIEVSSGLRHSDIMVGEGGSGSPTAASSWGGGIRSFIIAPGSTVMVESWLGDVTFSVTGTVAISSLMPNSFGFLESVPLLFSLQLHDTENNIIGNIALDLESADPIAVVDEGGTGILGLPLAVDLHSIQEEIDWSSQGLFETVWMELPFMIAKHGAGIDTEGSVQILDVCPVDPVQRVMLESEAQDIPPLPEVMIDPCDTMDSPNGTPWSYQALDWYWLITNSHPECFGRGN